jgi:two-component system NtrC family sensor kinase
VLFDRLKQCNLMRLHMASLHVIQGPQKGRIFELKESGNEIGRKSEALPLADGRISRKHARIFFRNGRWLIEDLGSVNGTFINGMEISRPMPLFPGNQILCGLTTLEFSDGEMPKTDIRLGDVEDGSFSESTIVTSVPSNEDSMILSAKAIGKTFQAEPLRFIYDLIAEASTILSIDKLLQVTLDRIFEVVKADRGFALLAEEGGKLRVKASKARKPDSDQVTPISQTILKEVINKQVGVLVSNAESDKRFSAGDSIHKLGIHSTICVPIKGRQRIFGIIQISCSVTEHTYTNEELRLLTAIGFQTGLAVDNLRLYESLVQSERMAAMGEAVAFLSHHIKNILQALKPGVEIVDLGVQKEDIEEIKSTWPIVQRAFQRINQLILNMLAFSKERKPLFRPVNIDSIIDECMELERPRADERGILLVKNLDYVPSIYADAAGIQQALLNLISNALEVVPDESGVVTVSSRLDTETNNVVMQVSDNGGGIEPEQLKKIFTPFFSNKGQKGTGLGLAVTHKVVKEHGGKIQVSSKINQGTRFTITLPARVGGERS